MAHARRLNLPLPACLAVALAAQLLAATEPEATTPVANSSPATTERYAPSYRATKVTEGPKVDGRLDDLVWQQAVSGGPLLDADKDPGHAMSQRTEFRILYDEDQLYIGVWCYDTEPDRITARIMERDARIFVDDYIYLLLDTFHDLRNGYVFALNPNGSRYDGLVSDNTRINSNWNGIWAGRATIDAEGWKAEIAIPFKTVSFDPNSSQWGFNLARDIRRSYERGRWASPRREASTYMPSEAGVLTGLEGMRQGLGLELTPYLKGSMEHDHESTRWTGDFGGDFRYRITPNLSATLSYNTDFAETEVDQRQVNLTRFPLFFPEKRAFFLEDSGLFQFGGLGANRYGFRSLLLPYYSRRIGLSTDGEPVPILLAGKVAGQVGPYGLGVLDAVLDEHADLGIENALVARGTRNVMEQSSIGTIVTVGDPNSPDQNVVFGPDLRFRTTSLGDGQDTLEADLFALGSYSGNGTSNWGHAFGTGLTYPNDLFRANIQFMEIDDKFKPALGFVRRNDTRAYTGYASYRPRPEALTQVRHLFFSYRNEFFTDLGNQLESYEHWFTPLGIQFESGDESSGTVLYEYDQPAEDFEIHPGVIVPADSYYWLRGGLGMEFASKRPLSGEISGWYGQYYGGTRLYLRGGANLLTWKHLGLSGDYTYNQLDLPGGEFDTHLVGTRMVWNFTPDLTWSHLIQYDTVSDLVGYNSRIQWEYRPGVRFFLVLNQNYLADGLVLNVEDTAVTAKASATFRF